VTRLNEFDIHETAHRDTSLTIKPTRCTNFSNLFLQWNSTCFGQFLCHHQEFFTVYTAMVYVIQVCWQPASRIRMEQGNYPKHEEFHSKNKYQKLEHLVGFIKWVW